MKTAVPIEVDIYNDYVDEWFCEPPEDRAEFVAGIVDVVDLTEAPRVTRRIYSWYPASTRVTVHRGPVTTKPKPAKKAKPTESDAAPVAEGKYLCEVCGTRFANPQGFGRHMKSEHWDDIVEEWELNGAVGLQRAFGIAVNTSYAWSKRIEAAAA